MAKLNDLERYLNYEFSSGCYTGNDYKIFERKYINYLRGLSKENDWEFVKANKNHYCFTAFVKKNNRYVYISVSDVRFNVVYRRSVHKVGAGNLNNRPAITCLFYGNHLHRREA